MLLADIAKVLGLGLSHELGLRPVSELLYDTRRLQHPDEALYAALKGNRDGHAYIEEAYHAGVRIFLVNEQAVLPHLPDAIWLKVSDPLRALQQVAKAYRQLLKQPLVGITGSNGKTVVKEWLYHLLQSEMKVERSPRSYNSQLGVALSLWQLSPLGDLALIEAGISTKYEMRYLKEIIDPQFGIFTGIGAAHDEGFENRTEKILEKLTLFENCQAFVYPADHELLHKTIADWSKDHPGVKAISWSVHQTDADLYFPVEIEGNHCKIIFENQSLVIPFNDQASIENACSCLAFLSMINCWPLNLNALMANLPVIEMRLQVLKAINQCELINDSYSNDLNSLAVALNFINKRSNPQQQILVLSRVSEAEHQPDKLQEMAALCRQNSPEHLILVGENWPAILPDFGAVNLCIVPNIKAVWPYLLGLKFQGQTILLKGSRKMGFEWLAGKLQEQVHETMLEIDLSALEQNYKQIKQLVGPNVKVMAMVKAGAYGAGANALAQSLQSAGCDYLAVAYTDEGALIRQQGISLPIMVMNARNEHFTKVFDYGLEPVIYDFHILEQLINNLNSSGVTQIGIHLEFDTGMNRLGFDAAEVEMLAQKLKFESRIKVCSVFSHLAGADDAEHDGFTLLQIANFEKICDHLKSLQIDIPLRHLLNSPGILRFPQASFEMVRAGLLLYGINPTNMRGNWMPVATFSTSITQIRLLKSGDSVGYGRKGLMTKEGKIAVIPVGYADGFHRILSNGRGHVWLNGKVAPIIGNICMDMTMIDVSEIDCKIGDRVELFGRNKSIEILATEANTIPYEILSSISQRVRRVYWKEG